MTSRGSYKSFASIIILISHLFIPTAADEAFTLGDPTYYGSGCPEGTVQTVTSSDGQEVSVLFSEYFVETSDEKPRERKSCNLAVPIDVQSGFSVGLFKVEYRGYTFIPSDGDYTKFYAEYFFAGMKGPTMKKKYKKDEDIYIANELGVAAYSPCGANTNLRINTSIQAKKKEEGKSDVEIGIDTTDVTVDNSFRFYLKTEKC